MKVKPEVDLQQLARDISKASKRFGETTRTAVARWGVATCRELAIQTQPHGVGGTRKRQQDAIESGMRAVLRPVDARTFRKAGGHTLGSPEAIDKWVDAHRGRRGHARLAGDRRAVCKKTDFNKALRARKVRAGMAKGGWIGAGQQIARHQRGADRLQIGKSFLSWAQKHADRGDARRTGSLLRPVAELLNNARHTRDPYVLKKGHMRRAVEWGGRKMLKWYQTALRKRLAKR